jgi:hypothetical protein
MRKKVNYVNHLGETLDLHGGGIWCDSGELADWEWAAKTLNGRTAGLYREQRTIPFNLIIVGHTEQHGLELRNALFETMEKDAIVSKPGRLYVDGWYLKCIAIYSRKDLYWVTGKAAKYEIGLLADDPVWTKEHSFSMSKDGTGTGLNFPYNFPYNFAGSSKEASYINNPGIMGAPVRMTIYGPASNPYVIIGKNRYEVEAEVKSGGKLVIDGTEKTITLYDEYGNAENAFSKRRGLQRQGSGSYVFQPVAPGENLVSWNGSFAFDVVLFEQRSERRWGS